MNRIAVLRVLVIAVAWCLVASMPALADDSVASIAAGGLVPRRETRIVMAREVLQISLKKIVVDYDFRNDTDQDVTTEVAFPVPPYEYDLVDGDIDEQSFSSFRLFVGDKPIPFKTEVKATLDGRDVTGVLVADKIDIASFGHTDESAGDETGGNFPIRDLIRLPKTEQEQLKAMGLFNMDEGFLLASWSVHLQYHWRQVFPAHSTVHIRHEYSPVVGSKSLTPSPEVIPLTNKPPYVRDAAKLNASDRDDLNLLVDFCPDTPILREFASKVYVESDGRRYVVLGPYWVDFILTSANTWQRPIEDFTLIIERPFLDERWTLVSFCSPGKGKVEKLDSDHFQVHLTNFVPRSELHIGFFPAAK
ncbi:MAG TPA: DUF4424 family protein [Terracidiphilus sp.]|nr:DUF4424 family protein [Terracidiphilus sp.]